MTLTKRLVAAALLVAWLLTNHPARLSAQQGNKPRLDQYGDPFPPGVAARLGTVRFRHEGGAALLAFSADGKKLVGYTSAGVIVWDAATGKELRRVAGPIVKGGGIMYADQGAVSPDGGIAIAQESGRGRGGFATYFWDLTTGKELPVPPGMGRRGIFRFSADGNHIALAAQDGKMQVLDLRTARLSTLTDKEKRSFTSLALSPDGSLLAAGVRMANRESSYALELWDIASGKKLHRLNNTKTMPVTAIAFTADGKTVAWGTYNQILLTDPATGKERDRFVDDLRDTFRSQPVGLAFTPDGKTLVVGTREGKIRVWDVASAEVVRTIDGVYPYTSGFRRDVALALSPDGKTVALGTAVPAVRLWDVTSGKERFTEFQGHTSPVTGLAFSPDGKALFSGSETEPIRVWETATWKQTRTLPTGAGSGTFSVSHDGKQLAAVVKRTVHLVDVAAGKVTRVLEVPEKDQAPAGFGKTAFHQPVFSLDDQTLFTVEGDRNRRPFLLRYWNLATGAETVRKLARRANQPEHSALAADGRTAVVCGLDEIFLYDVTTEQERLTHGKENELFLDALQLSPDGRVLALCPKRSWDCYVRPVEVLSGQSLPLLKGHDLPVSALAWSADGRFLATGDSLKRSSGNPKQATPSVRLWDTGTGKELARFGDLRSEVTSLALSPDAAFLAAGLDDSTILVWDVRKALARPAAPKLDKEELEARWAELIGDDAARAYQAAGALAAAPTQAVPLLRARLKPLAVVEAGKIQQWIADLSSEQAAVRAAAVKALLAVTPQAERALRQALPLTKSPEAVRHIERLLGKHAANAGETLRTLRGVLVLERIGSPEARAVLKELAAGAPGARETEETLAALARLAWRKPGGP